MFLPKVALLPSMVMHMYDAAFSPSDRLADAGARLAASVGSADSEVSLATRPRSLAPEWDFEACGTTMVAEHASFQDELTVFAAGSGNVTIASFAINPNDPFATPATRPCCQGHERRALRDSVSNPERRPIFL